MKITMISNYINHHQIPFSDALYEMIGENYHFIQTEPMEEERIQMGEAIGKGILQVLGIPLRENEETPTDSKEEVDLIFPPPSPEDPTKETEEKEGMKKVLRGLLIRFLKSLLEWLEKA